MTTLQTNWAAEPAWPWTVLHAKSYSPSSKMDSEGIKPSPAPQRP